MAHDAMHMVQDNSNNLKSRNMDKIDSTVVDCFTKIIDVNDSTRLDGSITLLRHLFEHNTRIDDDVEVKYALKRLVRGLGSSKVHSKKGYYSTLTIFLTLHPETPTDKILSIMNAELHPGNSNNKSENADIHMGRILTCGALIRSKLILQSAADIQQQLVEILLTSGKQRIYLSFVSTLFLIEFINHLETKSMKLVWPIIEKELGKSWEEQTLDTLYVLLIIKDKFPTIIDKQFLQTHLNTKDIISKESLDNIVKILTELPRIISCHHPVFTIFCEKLTTTELVTDLWIGIDRKFIKPSKSDEHVAVEILKLLLLDITDKSILPSLLSPNFLQHMLKKFSNLKRNNNDETIVSFREFLILLASTTSAKDVKSKIQINVLKKLILYPGDLMIEKKTGIKVVQIISGSLNTDGVKKLSKLYGDIIRNMVLKEKQDSKTESWTNAERIYVAQLLIRLIGHPAVLSEKEWRLDQLKLLFHYGLCEAPNVGVELAPHLKESFYRALDHKLPKLNDLRNILSDLVHYIYSGLNSGNLILKTPLTDASAEAWNNVIQLIEKLENNPNVEVIPIFHTMYLHMSLQLFSDPEMAISSIDELQKCYERVTKKVKSHKKSQNKEPAEEPDWVEVVVDLLLSLLSKNSHLLRSLVTCVFPHICPHLTTDAIYHIVSVLDIKTDYNPLSIKDDDEGESSDFDIDVNQNGIDESNGEETQSSSSDEESDLDNDEDSVNEDETVTDRLRLAVRQALGDAYFHTDDEDIDVDNIDEAEGKRLDESLAAAFKILRENRRSQSKKQEKSAQALTHFRARVIDLLEVYLESGPSMSIALDMLVPLFALLEFCIKDPHQKPLENRVQSCLKKLSTIKKFKNTECVDDNFMATILKSLIEKGERSASVCHEMGDKLAKCCTLLVRCLQYANLSNDTFISIYKENLTAFFQKRDSILPPLLFKSILQLPWEGNWKLVPLLVEFAFDNKIRSFRRGQALEFLTVFYKSGRLLHSDETVNTKEKIQIEKKLYKHSINMLQKLFNAQECENEKSTSSENDNTVKDVKQKFVYRFLILLQTVYAQHSPEAWQWQKIADKLAQYRTRTVLSKDTKSAFNKLVAQIGITFNGSIIRKSEDCSVPIVNGQTVEKTDEEYMSVHSDEDKDISAKTIETKKRNNKNKQNEKLLLKKEARELRAKAMSEGLDVFRFSSVVLPNGTNDVENVEIVENGKTLNEQIHDVTNHKRTCTDNTEITSTSKRKKKSKN